MEVFICGIPYISLSACLILVAALNNLSMEVGVSYTLKKVSKSCLTLKVFSIMSATKDCLFSDWLMILIDPNSICNSNLLRVIEVEFSFTFKVLYSSSRISS